MSDATVPGQLRSEAIPPTSESISPSRATGSPTTECKPEQAPGSTSRWEAVARSPVTPSDPVTMLAGWEVTGRRSTAALTLIDLAPLAKVLLKAPPDGRWPELLGVPFGRARRGAPVEVAGSPGAESPAGTESPACPPIELIAGSGPGEWLLLGPPRAAAQIVGWCRQQIRPGAATSELVSVVDLSHGRALLRLSGDRAGDVLAQLCPIDLSDQVTDDGAAFRSSVGGLATDVIRSDTPRGRSYLLHCERSCGQWLFDSLLDAGDTFGLEVDGFVDLGVRGAESRP